MGCALAREKNLFLVSWFYMSEHLHLRVLWPLDQRQGALPRRVGAPPVSGMAVGVFPSSSIPSLVLCSRLSLIPLKERRSWNGLPLSTKRST
jgi:hypothetical protein